MGKNRDVLLTMRVHAHLQVEAWTKSLANIDDMIRISDASDKAHAEKAENEAKENATETKEAPAAKKTSGKKAMVEKPSEELRLPTPPKSEAPKKEGITVDSVREKVIAVSNKLGKEKALEVLAQYKAKKVAELKPEQLEVVNDVLDGLLSEEKKEEESSEIEF